MESLGYKLELGVPREGIFTVIRTESPRPTDCRSAVPYCRGEKSLSELSRRFLAGLWTKENHTINLEVMTKELGIERRRLYDIINILEGLQLIYRVSKSAFLWRGLAATAQSLPKFEAFLTKSTAEGTSPDLERFMSEQLGSLTVQARVSRRDKSLALLSLRMVQEFHVGGPHQTLDQLAGKLEGEAAQARHKTMIRRLYDITNVFKAVGLVRKTTNKDRSVAIEWLGVRGILEKLAQEGVKVDASRNIKHSQLGGACMSQQSTQEADQVSPPLRSAFKLNTQAANALRWPPEPKAREPFGDSEVLKKRVPLQPLYDPLASLMPCPQKLGWPAPGIENVHPNIMYSMGNPLKPAAPKKRLWQPWPVALIRPSY